MSSIHPSSQRVHGPVVPHLVQSMPKPSTVLSLLVVSYLIELSSPPRMVSKLSQNSSAPTKLKCPTQAFAMGTSDLEIPVTVKTFGLLPDRALIWLDFPDFKHDYIKEVYRSDVCFAGRGLRNGDFHGDWNSRIHSQIYSSNMACVAWDHNDCHGNLTYW